MNAALAAVIAAATSVAATGSHKGILDWLSGAILVGLILVIATLLPRLRRVFGLCERFVLAVTYIWLVVVAWLLAVWKDLPVTIRRLQPPTHQPEGIW